MPIVSISLNDEILQELDKLQGSMGFTGRSENYFVQESGHLYKKKNKKTILKENKMQYSS